jgi:hypothetical protein
MKVSRLNTSLLLSLLLLLFSITVTARAADDDEDDYDVKARVVRISLIYGDVNLKRNGNQDWEPVRLNYPVVEGDTLTTAKDSRLEIQIDARNFVRLAPGSVLRIVTLRDEGIALSLVEGTATIRLAKFDRGREYFEIDAPKTTLAAEKTGLYRIDVPGEGRVRLTVRDGGSARIYSDTSGFALRDGRSAELVSTGDNAGDWEFLAAATRDAIDEWVDDRERYLARRLKYDVKYYDEYVWGAEDLDAYGDWNYTDDFGWIWRPRSTVISAYHDWAPYRYGHWTWCPPYGWTWVGYEPWGWAPYHYGRWVYHNDYWAWVPRSQFHKKRSWWRPALVAFVGFNISFGDNICWYPLSYYQRDPHSRHYRHNNRRYDRRDGDGNNRPRYDGNKTWRGVTRVPRRDFGNDNRPGQRVDEQVARRVLDSEPQRGGDLPRGGYVRNAPGDSDRGPGRSGRISPVIHIPDRATGATERAPGVSLDEDLRRSRVFRGRDPRPTPRTEPTTTTPATTTTPVTTETRPTGAVARPEPRTDRPDRVVGPRLPDNVEKRRRGQEGIEDTPRATPEPRADQPAPSGERPRRETQPEPVRSQPRLEPRTEPRSEPRSEPRESRPEPRSESPRPAPRSEPETPRSEPRSQPKFEVPRSEPRSEPRSQPRSEPSRSESPRSESPRSESPRSESPRSESPRPAPSRSESPRSEPSRSESPRSEPSRSESPRSEPSRSESPRSEPSRSESPRSEPSRSESPRSESPRSESPRSESPRPGRPDKPMH